MATRKRRQRGINLLKEIQVRNARPHEDGRPRILNDGHGLALMVERADDGSIRKRWLQRYYSPVKFRSRPDGTLVKARREAGLGTPGRITLAKVRELALQYRERVKLGFDPLEEKHEQQAAAREEFLVRRAADKSQRDRERHTLLRVTRDYHERYVEPERRHKDSRQWIADIERHVPKRILDTPIADLRATDLLNPLKAKIREIPETGRRIVQRLGNVFVFALVGPEGGKPLVATNLIAEIRPLLRVSKKEQAKQRTHFASLPFGQVPAFVAAMREREASTGALALEFLIRTAARTGEVLGATWAEVDLEAAVWTVPAERMKAHELHTVFLPPRAVEILERLRQAAAGGEYVFASPMDMAMPLSNMAMAAVIRRMNEARKWLDPQYGTAVTVHGFRSSFSSWCYESAQRARPELARPDVIEACLAHKEADRVKAAYSRSKFDDDRRELLALWSAFIDSKPAQVLDIKPGAKPRKRA